MPRPTANPQNLPTSHTAIIGDVAGMWSKLRWDADLFRDLQLAWPDEREPLAYAAVNVCIAACSLRDWVKADLRRREPRADRPTPKAIVQEIWTAVPLQPMCEAIANTAKHSVLSDQWDGKAVLAWEADEESPPGYVLRYSAADGSLCGNYSLAANQFHDLLADWEAYLLAKGLISAAQRTPDWQHRKILKIFPAPHGSTSPG